MTITEAKSPPVEDLVDLVRSLCRYYRVECEAAPPPMVVNDLVYHPKEDAYTGDRPSVATPLRLRLGMGGLVHLEISPDLTMVRREMGSTTVDGSHRDATLLTIGHVEVRMLLMASSDRETFVEALETLVRRPDTKVADQVDDAVSV